MLCEMMSVGRLRFRMTLATVNVFPEPVTPSSVWCLSPASIPAGSFRIAPGWSPAGSKGECSLNAWPSTNQRLAIPKPTTNHKLMICLGPTRGLSAGQAVADRTPPRNTEECYRQSGLESIKRASSRLSAGGKLCLAMLSLETHSKAAQPIACGSPLDKRQRKNFRFTVFSG